MTPPQHERRTPSRPPTGPDGAAAPSGLSMSDLLASCAAASAVSTPPTQGASQEGAEGAARDDRGAEKADEGADADTDTDAEADASAGRRVRHRGTRPVPAR